MYVMPKKIDPALRDPAVRLLREHQPEYPSLTAASAAVARHLGVGHESVRRWVLQADSDEGTRDGVTSADHAEIKRLKAENTHLREDVAILRAATSFFVGELDPELFQVERSLRMAKTDLRARPMFHHQKDSIQAHLTILFTALAVASQLQDVTGISIRKPVRTLRPLRDITIRIAGNEIVATTQPGPEAATILDTITR